MKTYLSINKDIIIYLVFIDKVILIFILKIILSVGSKFQKERKDEILKEN